MSEAVQYREAVGRDGRFHPWSELSEVERRDWIAGQTAADDEWEMMKNGWKRPTVADDERRWEAVQMMRRG